MVGTAESMRAVVVRAFGGPEVLRVERVPRPPAAAGTTLIKVRRAGVNYFDLERRSVGWNGPGSVPPVILGTEVAGVRVSDGARVVGLTEAGLGGYAEYASVAEEFAVPIPYGVSDAAALAALVQGLTAWHALALSAMLQRGESVVVTAAAGGVGSLAMQLARMQGAGRIIALASSEAKRRVAVAFGADAAVDSAVDGLPERVREANGGAPVDVVLKSVAGPILDALLTTLAPGGRLVAYGQASGASNHVSVDTLMDRAIGVVGFWLTPLLEDRQAIRHVIEKLLAAIAERDLRVIEGPSFPISQARAAHALVGSRGTVGKVTLTADEVDW